MKLHIKNLSRLTDNSYLRADFKFTYYHDTSFIRLKANWKGSVKLRQIISKMRNGQDFSKKVYADYETDTCYVRVNNLKPIGEFIAEDIVFLKDEEIEKFSNLFIDEDDFLITRSGTVGIAFKFIRHDLPEYIRNKDFIPAGYIIVIKVRDLFNDEYLKYFLYSSISRRYFEALACGKSQQNISQADLGKWLVPLQILKNIPINEIKEKEQEISQLKTQIKETKLIVDEVFGKYFQLNFNSNLEKEIVFEKTLLDLSKSVQLRSSFKFHHPKFDFILKELKEFKTVKLKHLLKEPVFSGVKPDYDRHDGTIPVIKTINIKDGAIEYDTEDYVNSDFIKLLPSKKILSSGDIIITTHGEGRGKIGLLSLEDKDFDGVITDANCSVVRLKEDVNKKFVYYYLISEFGKAQLKMLEAETKSVRYIPNEEIEKILVIYHSSEIQEKIVEEIEIELNEQKKIIDQIESLKQEIDKLIEKAIEVI
jgi:type I restriction enzyme S subunit